ncbi:unnamed protein product [Chrysoparadoxa australica]
MADHQDLLSLLAKAAPLHVVSQDFPKSHAQGLDQAAFAKMLYKHLGRANLLPKNPRTFTQQSVSIFKQMDMRGDGEVSWRDFSMYLLSLDASDLGNRSSYLGQQRLMHRACITHLGLNDGAMDGAITSLTWLGYPVGMLAIVVADDEVVQVLTHCNKMAQLPARGLRVERGGSGICKTTFQLRHDTAYKPHTVHAVHSIADLVITSSSLGNQGPHFMTLWDLPTFEERDKAEQHLPVQLQREEVTAPQGALLWSVSMEMLFSVSKVNGAMLGWTLENSKLQQVLKVWTHDAGITGITEMEGVIDASFQFLLSCSLDGQLTLWGGPKSQRKIIQKLPAHEKGVHLMSQSSEHGLIFTAGVFANVMDTTPDVFVWKKERKLGLRPEMLRRLVGHSCQVVGIVVVDSQQHLVSGDAKGIFYSWSLPELSPIQRFHRAAKSPLVGSPLTSLVMVPDALGPGVPLLAASSRGVDYFIREQHRVHDPLISAVFCPQLKEFVTVSRVRVTIWDSTTGCATNTFTVEDLCGDCHVEITAFCLLQAGHKFAIGDDNGKLRVCSRSTGACLKVMDPHEGMVSWVAAPNYELDKCIYSSCSDGRLRVMDEAEPGGYRPGGGKWKPTSVLLRQAHFSAEKTMSTAMLMEAARQDRSSSVSLGSLSAAVSEDSAVGSPLFDMGTAAADAHLNLIATATQVERSHLGGSLNGFSESSYIHVWDYEMCSLVGTCSFPAEHSLLVESAQDKRTAAQAKRLSAAMVPELKPEEKEQDPPLRRLCSFTSLAFLAPYPLLVGAGPGFAAIWKVPECVCIACMAPPDGVDSHLLVSMTVGVLDGTHEVMVFAGTDAGCVMTVKLSADTLTELGVAAVPSQRRPNHNPYRAVDEMLSREAILMSASNSSRNQKHQVIASHDFTCQWMAHTDTVSCLSWIKESTVLLSSSRDGLAKLWSITDEGSELVGTLDINTPVPQEWSFNAAVTASGADEGEVQAVLAALAETRESSRQGQEQPGKDSDESGELDLEEALKSTDGAAALMPKLDTPRGDWEGMAKGLEKFELKLASINMSRQQDGGKRFIRRRPKEGHLWKTRQDSPDNSGAFKVTATPDLTMKRLERSASQLVPKRRIKSSRQGATTPGQRRAVDDGLRMSASLSALADTTGTGTGTGAPPSRSRLACMLPSTLRTTKSTPSLHRAPPKMVLAVSKGGMLAASDIRVHRTEDGSFDIPGTRERVTLRSLTLR